MKKAWISRLPYLLTLVQAVILSFFSYHAGGFRLVLESDSSGYFNFPFDSFSDALSHTRTIGYPIFLKCIHFFSSDWSVLPLVQWVIHVLSVFLFLFSLKRFGFSDGLALFTVSPLLYLDLVRIYSCRVLTESLSCSLTIITLSFLFLVVQSFRNKLYWIGLVIFLFASYQVRPANLILIGLIPLLGMIFFVFSPKFLEGKGRSKALGMGLLAAAIIPYLFFGLTRWYIVGHFGLVSFGGYNLSGITLQILSKDVIKELPPHLQDYAMRLHEEQIRRNLVKENEQGPKYDYELWYKRFNPTCHQIAYAVTQSLVGNDMVLINQKLTEISIAIIKVRFSIYLTWVMKVCVESIKFIFSIHLVFYPFLFLLCLDVLFITGCETYKVVYKKYDEHFSRGASGNASIYILMITYSFLNMFLIAVVEQPLPRYLYD